MDGLPWNLLDEILFRIDPRSLAMMRCTNRSFHSHISKDPYFESEYLSRVGSGLLHISTDGSTLLCYHPHGDSRSPKTIRTLKLCHILGSCSGLLLLFVDGLCVANPLTKKFRLLNHFRSRFFPWVITGQRVIGFAVDQTTGDRTTQRFKIVIITELRNNGNQTTYGFEVNAGVSWKLSKTRVTCNTSNLDNRMRKPVYLDGSLHWLRNDGSIVAFNTKTEKALLIPVRFPQDLSSRTVFAADDNDLTLISATEKVIYVYVLKNILSNPKWVLVRRIGNGVLDEKKLIRWNVEAYDGKCLVLSEMKTTNGHVVHGYDLRAKKWGVMGSIPGWCDWHRNFFQFSPSSYSMIGLDKKDKEKILGWDAQKRISSIISIMVLISGTFGKAATTGKTSVEVLKRKRNQCC